MITAGFFECVLFCTSNLYCVDLWSKQNFTLVLNHNRMESVAVLCCEVQLI